MAPVHDPPRGAELPEPRTRQSETWTSAGQAVATAAGTAALVGLVAGPEGAAVAAVIGGLFGVIVALQRIRSEQQHNEHDS